MNCYEKGLIELKDKLVKTLQKELPNKYMYKIEEFLITGQNINVRHAWLVLDSLCHFPDWSPSPVLIKYIEDYCAYVF